MLRTVEASTYFRAPGPLVYSILVGYEAYREWVPDVVESRLFAREGDVAVAQFLSPPYRAGKFVLEFVETPRSGVVFTEIDRYGRSGLTGRWDLEEADGGAGVVVKGVLSLRAGVFRLGSRGPMRRVLERTLTALADRSMRLAASGATGEEGERREVLEIVRGADSVEVRLDGEVFHLVRGAREGTG